MQLTTFAIRPAFAIRPVRKTFAIRPVSRPWTAFAIRPVRKVRVKQ